MIERLRRRRARMETRRIVLATHGNSQTRAKRRGANRRSRKRPGARPHASELCEGSPTAVEAVPHPSQSSRSSGETRSQPIRSKRSTSRAQNRTRRDLDRIGRDRLMVGASRGSTPTQAPQPRHFELGSSFAPDLIKAFSSMNEFAHPRFRRGARTRFCFEGLGRVGPLWKRP